jgi:flavin-dependent dehydrogenase
MYDAIVVGARVAGSPTAMLLARKGYRVLVVDRATFPSDTFRSHMILHPGNLQLKRWGLLDRVIALGTPAVHYFVQDMGDFGLRGRVLNVDGVDALYAPRRKYLDNLLAQAAVEAGAELYEGFSVQQLLWDGDRVIGIQGRTQTGTNVTELAKIVIGADGQHSTVARAVGAPTYNERPVLTWAYYSYWSGVAVSDAEFYRHDDIAMLAFPTNDGLTGVAAFGPIAGFPAFRSDIEANFYKTLDTFPQLTERVRAGQRAERWLGSADLPNFFRKPYGSGWALVGDAGYHRDPVTGTGISEAFRDSELLVEAVDAGLTGRQPLDQALAGYEIARNALAYPSYEMTLQAATFGPLPGELYALRGALAGNQADTDQYFGVLTGAVSPMAFYAPENIGRIMQAAMLAAA